MDKEERYKLLEQIVSGIKERRKDVADLLSKRTPKRKIVDYLVKKYDISGSMAYKDIKYVIDYWREESNTFSVDDHMHHAMNLREEMINKAMESGNLSLAFKIQQDFDQMLGLYDKNKEPEYKIVIHKTDSCASDDGPVTDEEMEAYRKSLTDDEQQKT